MYWSDLSSPHSERFVFFSSFLTLIDGTLFGTTYTIKTPKCNGIFFSLHRMEINDMISYRKSFHMPWILYDYWNLFFLSPFWAWSGLVRKQLHSTKPHIVNVDFFFHFITFNWKRNTEKKIATFSILTLDTDRIQ